MPPIAHHLLRTCRTRPCTEDQWVSKLFAALVIWKRFLAWYRLPGILADIGPLATDYTAAALANKRVLPKDCFVVEGW